MQSAPQAVPEGNPLERMLSEMTQRGASDLLLIAGNPPILRLGGRLVRIEDHPLDGDDLGNFFAGFITPRLKDQLHDAGAADFSLYLGKFRFRVNLHRQRGALAAAIRALPTEVPTLAQLNLPPTLAELVKPTRGLVLVCGPTGSGKTTTLARWSGRSTAASTRHIITIEDPIEYEHRNGSSVIEQIEIGPRRAVVRRRAARLAAAGSRTSSWSARCATWRRSRPR